MNKMPRAPRRSRDGCWTCRKRKKKCDNPSTPCNNCKRLNLKCQTGVELVWEDDSRRAGMSRRGPPANKPVNSVDLKTETYAPESTMNHQDNLTSTNAEEGAGALTSLFKMRPSGLVLKPLDERESLLLNHYIQRFSRTYPTCSDTNNPFLSVLIPISMRSPLVLDSMLALSGAPSWGGSTQGLRETTLVVRQRALAGCRQMLPSPTSPESPGKWIETLSGIDEDQRLTLLASCILLLLYEKLSGEGQTNWMPHLDFIHEIWSHHGLGSGPSPAHFEALQFLQSLYLYNDLVRSTSLRVPTQSSFYLRHGEAEQSRHFYPHLISRLSARDSSVTDADILQWDGCLSWLPSFALTGARVSNAVSWEDDDATIASALYRTTALVYRRQMTGDNDLIDCAQAADLAAQAVLGMQSLPEGSPFENALLWPIGIVAKSLQGEQNHMRHIVLQRLDYLNRRFQMRHFVRAQEILINHWWRMDGNCRQAFVAHDGSYLELQGDTILLG